MAEYEYVQKDRLDEELTDVGQPAVDDEVKKILDTWKGGGSIWSRPISFENLLIFGANDGHIYALNRPDGSLVWKCLTDGNVMSSPVIYDGVVYVGSLDKKFYAIDAKTGEKKWDFLTGGRIPGTADVVDGLVYFGSEDGKIYCLNTDGEKQWEFITGGIVFGSITVLNGKVYAGSCDRRFYCIEKGRKVWSFLAGGEVGDCTIVDTKTGEPVAGFRVKDRKTSEYRETKNLVVCFGSFDCYFYGLDIDGKMLWKHKTNDIAPITRGYAVKNNIIYFGANEFYALDVRNGSKLWGFRGSDRIGSTCALIHKGVVFTGSYDGNLYALNAMTGEKIFVFRTGGGTFCPASVYDDILYFGSTDTYMYALNLDTGKTDWTFKTGSAPTPVAWRGILKNLSPLQRLKRWWKAEVKPKSTYDKQEEKKVEWAPGYGMGNTPYQMNKGDVAYTSGMGQEYGMKRDLDKEKHDRFRKSKW